MKWYLLQYNRCPTCAATLTWQNGRPATLLCSRRGCGYKIDECRLRDIVSDMTAKVIRKDLHYARKAFNA